MSAQPTPEFTLHAPGLAHFARNGWVGSWPLLSPQQAQRLVAERRRVEPLLVPGEQIAQYPELSQQGRVWFKSLHEVSADFFDIGHDPRIVGRVRALLGPDVLLWGCSTRLMPHMHGHDWHIDVEHRRWYGVSVYVGLSNLTPRNTLAIATGTQNVLATPRSEGLRSNDEVFSWCAEKMPDTQLQLVYPGPHGFFIFDGPVWHGATNPEELDREIMILQYCAADQVPQVPVNWEPPVRWHGRPACALVAGQDRSGRNRIIGRPKVQAS